MSVSPIDARSGPTPIDHVVSLGEEATARNILRRAFYDAWLAGDQPALRTVTIGRSIVINAGLPPHLVLDRSIVDEAGVMVTARGPRSTVLIEVQGDDSCVRLTAATDGEADSLRDKCVALWGAAEPTELINMQLWRGGFNRTHKISAPFWSEVAHNYPAGPRAQLDRLMHHERPRDNGKLILWHGSPGTGKTSAIRALARAWASWCKVQYITDPDKLFADPDYLISVLSRGPVERPSITLDTADAPERSWQLIVAEDSDEYLRSADGQAASGALGRILNVTDGILGQSFDSLVLLTTNEDVTKLHPALTRPGRCLARIPFQKFTPAEAAEWLGDSSPKPRAPMTLAELLLISGDLQINDAENIVSEHTGMYL